MKIEFNPWLLESLAFSSNTVQLLLCLFVLSLFFYFLVLRPLSHSSPLSATISQPYFSFGLPFSWTLRFKSHPLICFPALLLSILLSWSYRYMYCSQIKKLRNYEVINKSSHNNYYYYRLRCTPNVLWALRKETDSVKKACQSRSRPRIL